MMRVYDLKAGHSRRVLASNNPTTFTDPTGLDWRLNGSGGQTFNLTPEFAAHLKTIEPQSIKRLDLSGHGAQRGQNMLVTDGGDLSANRMLVGPDGTLNLQHDGKNLDPSWIEDLKRALDPNAKVIFSGCHSGVDDPNGVVRKFSETFPDALTIGSPDFVVYPGDFPASDSTFSAQRQNLDQSWTGVTPGGNWNLFRGGQYRGNIRGGSILR